MRKLRGCDAPCEIDFPFDPELHRCPWSAMDFDSLDLLRQYRAWTSLRILPYGGDQLGEQPQPLVEAFELFARIEEQKDVSADGRMAERLAAALTGVLRGTRS